MEEIRGRGKDGVSEGGRKEGIIVWPRQKAGMMLLPISLSDRSKRSTFPSGWQEYFLSSCSVECGGGDNGSWLPGSPAPLRAACSVQRADIETVHPFNAPWTLPLD